MTEILYTLISLIPVLFATLGTAIGQGLIGKQAIHSMQKQPSATDSISKLCIIATAVTETAAVMGIVITLLLLNDLQNLQQNSWASFGITGIAFAVGVSGFFAGISSSYPAIAACSSLARQPFLQTKIMNLMLITQTLIMTPNIFGMLIALLIKNKLADAESFNHAVQLLASGMSIGLGGIGPSVGLSLFAFAACSAIGVNKQAYGKILTFTFICEAIIETPAIFALLISLMILTTTVHPTSDLQGWQFIAAALCIGLSTISPGINSGRTGATAATQIGKYLEQYPNISKITLLALAMIDSFAIYGLIIAIIMLIF